MRILFLSDLWDPERGSLVRQIHARAKALRSRGHTTRLFSTRADGGPADEIVHEGLEIVRVPSRVPPRWRALVGLWNPPVLRALRNELVRFRPEVVHAELVHSQISYRALPLAAASGARVVFSAHDAMTFCYQKMTCFHGGEAAGGRGEDWRARWSKCAPCQGLRFLPGRNAAIRRALRAAERITAVSEALAARLRDHGLRCEEVIPNACLPPPAAPSPARLRAARERWNLGSSRVVLFAGRVQEQKGILALLRAFEPLARQHADLALLVAGPRDAWAAHAQPLARELGLESRLRVAGWLAEPELEEAYALSRVLCVPSTCFETFGLVHLEAMARGVPAIGTIYGGVPETIGDGGAVVNPFDREALRRALEELLFDDALHARACAAALARARTHFDAERVLERWLDVYGVRDGATRASHLRG
ncbi:MAG: glycosyltransferase family 4 protein [Planctomycetes bacterium]|nr:glycosyltransferase family 4 protein [Planctomycetota bacterium]